MPVKKPIKKNKKKPLRKVHTTVDFGTIPFTVIVSIGETNKEFIDNLIEIDGFTDPMQLYDVSCMLKDQDSLSVAHTFHIDSGDTMIKIDSCIESCEDYGYLHHEIFHAVDMITRRIGIELVDQSCEIYSYMIEHLTVELYKLLGVPSDGNA